MKKLLWIVVQGYCANEFYYERMIIRAEKLGLNYKVFYQEGIQIKDGEFIYNNAVVQEKPDLIYTRGLNADLNKYFFGTGIRCVNSIFARVNCNDKIRTHKLLDKCPFVKKAKYFHKAEKCGYDEVVENVGSPFVMKARYGNGGQGVVLVNNKHEYETEIAKYEDARGVFFEEFIKTSFGKDLRVHVFGDVVAGAVIRQSAGGKDFRSNFSQGGTVREYACPDKLKQTAVEIAKALKGEIMSVDFMFDGDDFVFCEANTEAIFVPGLGLPEASIDYIYKVLQVN